jgi:hypothetical protein
MKEFRTIPERIFLGRNTGNLTERFSYHLLLTVQLLIVSAVGLGISTIVGRLAETG